MAGYLAPGACPVCGDALELARLYCSHCKTVVEGHFAACRFCGMNTEQRALLEALVKTRGNLRDMEGILELSYPTIRNRLDALSEALFPTQPEGETVTSRQQVLDMLERGELQPGEAAALLKKMK